MIVDLASVFYSTRTISVDGDEDKKGEQNAIFRINLSLIMGVLGGILICLP